MLLFLFWNPLSFLFHHSFFMYIHVYIRSRIHGKKKSKWSIWEFRIGNSQHAHTVNHSVCKHLEFWECTRSTFDLSLYFRHSPDRVNSHFDLGIHSFFGNSGGTESCFRVSPLAYRKELPYRLSFHYCQCNTILQTYP